MSTGYTDRGLGIGDLSIGVSTAGLQTYKDGLRASLLTTVSEKIDNIDAINTELNRGWQGVSRDKFDVKFQGIRDMIKQDLAGEYANLEARLDELAYDYIKQDQNMIAD